MWQRILNNQEALILAAIGGFFMNMMNLYEDHKRPRSKRVRKDGLYWIFFVFCHLPVRLLSTSHNNRCDVAGSFCIPSWADVSSIPAESHKTGSSFQAFVDA